MDKIKNLITKLLNGFLSFAPIRYIRVEWHSIREVAAIHREYGVIPDELEMEDLTNSIDDSLSQHE